MIGITGVEGFIGSHLSEKFDSYVGFAGDLTSLDDVRAFVSACDIIYHLAGKNREVSGDILKNNIVSTGNIVLACMLECVTPDIYFISSNQVMWNRDSEYALAKKIEEAIICQTYGWHIERIPNVYGPGARPNYNSVVANFCYNIATGKSLVINDPNVKREFIYVEDLVNNLGNVEFNTCKIHRGEILSIGEIASFLTFGLGTHEKLAKTLDYYVKRYHSTEVEYVSSS